MSAMPTRARPRQTRRLVWLLAGVLAGAGVVLLVTNDDRQPRGLQGSGVSAAQARVVPAFDSVELAGSNVVTIDVGGKRSVVVRGDDNLLSRVTTTVRAGRLVIDTVGSIESQTPMRVAITLPSLDALALSGSGMVYADGVRATTLRVTLPGSGMLRARGTAGRLVATLDGSGVAELTGLVARDARALVSGSGRIDITATRSLDASIPGTGAIVYGGDPARVTREIAGTGAITRR